MYTESWFDIHVYYFYGIREITLLFAAKILGIRHMWFITARFVNFLKICFMHVELVSFASHWKYIKLSLMLFAELKEGVRGFLN